MKVFFPVDQVEYIDTFASKNSEHILPANLKLKTQKKKRGVQVYTPRHATLYLVESYYHTHSFHSTPPPPPPRAAAAAKDVRSKQHNQNPR
jgi:hypothetical protein